MRQTWTERYAAALHGLQSLIKYEMSTGADNGHTSDPKHLRVGIDSALISNGALAKLLVDKGVITAAEIEQAVTVATEQELARRAKPYTDRGIHFA